MARGGERRRRQAAILEVAERLLHHYGINKTTVADIAREAGIGVGSIYLEFPSKGAIVAALAERERARILDAMRAQAERPGPYPRRLRGCLDRRVRGLLALAGRGAHAREILACPGPEGRRLTARFRREEEALIRGLLVAGQRAAELRVDQPAVTTRVILRLYDAFVSQDAAATPAGTLRAEIAATHRLVLAALAPR